MRFGPFLILLAVPMFLGSQLMKGSGSAPTPKPASDIAQAPGVTTTYAPARAKACNSTAPCEITSDGYYGCVSADVEDRIGTYVTQGDKPAFMKALKREIGTGGCVRWRQGDKVYVQESGFARHCLRPDSKERCYWTVVEAVKI